MIPVRFTTFEFDADAEQWIELPVAELVAEGEEVRISGPHADWISPDIAIVDPQTSERVRRSDDAERWARLLPLAYRDGEMTVQVSEVAQDATGAEPAGGAFRYPAAA